MKRALVLLAVVALTASLYADPFADFRIPKHTVCNLLGSFSGSYSGAHSNQGTYFQDNDRGSGGVGLNAMRLYDSDPLRAYFNLSLSSSGTLEKYRAKFKNSLTDYGVQHNDRSSGNESWVFSGSTRAYPWTLPLGAFADLSANARYDQSHDKTFSESANDITYMQNHSTLKRWTYDYNVSGSVGLGYGRVRDVSAVYIVYVMEQRLKESGAATRDLSSAAREKLADLLYAQKDFNIVYDRPARRFWQDVEQILRDDGALRPEGLNAFDTYRLIEPLMGYPSSSSSTKTPRGVSSVFYLSNFARTKGYFFGLAVNGYSYNAIYREEQSHDQITALIDSMESADHQNTQMFTRQQRFTDYVAFGPQLEYHMPWGMRWQFDAATSVLFPQHRGNGDFMANSRVTASYLIADRWYSRVNIVHNRQIMDDKRSDYYNNRWAAQGVVELHYFVEDRADMFVIMSHSQSRRDDSEQDYGSHHDPQFQRDTSVSLGLSYHFRGKFTAPDLGITSLLPPMVWPWAR
jgi:hypothetical protein